MRRITREPMPSDSSSINQKTVAIQKWLKAPWPEESLKAQYRFGCMAARLYPFLHREVHTPQGTGKLVQVFDGRVTVVFDGSEKAEFFNPWDVVPIVREHRG